MRTRNIIIAGAATAAVIAGIVTCYATRRSIPEGVTAVEPFDSQKYLGHWFEIARMDFSHEKNMSYVSAFYSLNDNGTIGVLNKGYDTKAGEWKEAKGKAKFVVSKNVGQLKVSFFGPFYSGYNVVEIDPDYRYALVIGRNLDYMWILSRTETIPDHIREHYLARAQEIGFDIEKLVWTKQ